MKKRANINLKVLAFLLAGGMTLTSPTNIYAKEGDILYIQEEDEHEEVDLTDETKEDMIKAEEDKDKAGNNSQSEENNQGANSAQGEENSQESNNGQTNSSQEDTKKEYGKNEFIDGDNYKQENDIDENAGKEIPDTTPTESERKHGKPDKPSEPEIPEIPYEPEIPNRPIIPYEPEIPEIPYEPEIPDRPIIPYEPEIPTIPYKQPTEPAPKTGDNEVVLAITGVGLACLVEVLRRSKKKRKDIKAILGLIKKEKAESLDDKPIRVTDIREKTAKRSKVKKLF